MSPAHAPYVVRLLRSTSALHTNYPLWWWALQILMEAKQKLGGTVRQKLAGAIVARKHEDVVRFTRLFRPLRMQVCT